MPAWFRIAPSADGMVVAGDFRVGVYTAIEELRSLIRRQTPIVFVAGSHEYYGQCLPEQPAGAAAIADKHDVTFLENRAAVIQGVRFLGCTIWTDYALFGITARSSAMKTAGGDLNDHRLISMTTEPRQ